LIVKEYLNRDDGATYTVRCLTCRNDTRHHVVLSLMRVSHDGDWWWSDVYQIVQCRGCQSPTFRHERTDPDSDQTDPETGEHFLDADEALYPARESRREMEYAQFLPMAVQKLYREVLKSLASGTPVLAAIGLRTLVTGCCNDLGAKGTLKEMINGLASSGRLRPAEAAILHSLRDTGNASAHECCELSRDALLKAVVAVEHVITSVYLLSHYQHEFRPE
jgi:hypothetical protein